MSQRRRLGLSLLLLPALVFLSWLAVAQAGSSRNQFLSAEYGDDHVPNTFHYSEFLPSSRFRPADSEYIPALAKHRLQQLAHLIPAWLPSPAEYFNHTKMEPYVPEEHYSRYSGVNSHFSVQFDSMRNTMLGTKWMANTQGSQTSAMNFLRNFPRKKPDGSHGTNQLQSLTVAPNGTDSANWNPVADYVDGMFFMWGTPLFFAMLAIVIWVGFCISRCWCNVCGRHATKLYTERQININYALTFLLIIIMGICCAFGWTGNVEVSQGIDASFVAADTLANYGYEFMGSFSNIYASGYDAYLLGVALNSTLSTLPGEGQLNFSTQCTQDSYNTFHSQSQFVATLGSITPYFTGNLANVIALNYSATGLGTVEGARLNLATPDQTGFTGLQQLQQQLTDINAAFASIDSADFSALSTALTTLAGFPHTSPTTGLCAKLSNDLQTFLTAASNISPALTAALDQHYTALETAISLIPITLFGDTETKIMSTASSDVSPLSTDLQTILSLMGNTFPSDMKNFVNLMLAFQGNVTVLNGTLATLPADMAAFTAQATQWPASDPSYTTITNQLGPVDNFQTQYGAILQNILVSELPNIITAITNMQLQIQTTQASFGHTEQQVRSIIANVDTSQVANAILQFKVAVGDFQCFQQVFSLIEYVNATFVIMPQSVTDLDEKMTPLMIRQIQLLPTIYAAMDMAVDQLNTINATVLGPQPDYAGTNTSLTTLLNYVNSMPSFTGLWSQLYTLQQDLFAITRQYGVKQTGTAQGVTFATVNTFSATAALVNLPSSVTMTAALTALQNLINQITPLIGPSALSATYLQLYVNSILSFNNAINSVVTNINQILPIVSLPLPSRSQNRVKGAIDAFIATVANRPASAQFNGTLHSMYNVWGKPTVWAGIVTNIQTPIFQLNASLDAISPGQLNSHTLPALPVFQTEADPAQQTQLNTMVGSGVFLSFQNALNVLPDANTINFTNSQIQIMNTNFLITGVNALIIALNQPGLFMSASDRDNVLNNINNMHHFIDNFPDMNSSLSAAQQGLSAISSALSYMQSKKLAYQTNKANFQATVDNYDGIRILVFNMGSLAPFAMSFFLLIAAVQNYGCPAMVAGLMFFPLFIAYMIMTALQVPLSVALSDHCYNTTGEIQVQTAGVVYPKDKLSFFNLRNDLDVAAITDYVTQCVGNPPELLQRVQNPRQLIKDNGFDADNITAIIRQNTGMVLAAPLQSDMDQLKSIEQDAVGYFLTAAGRLNCTTSSGIYNQLLDAACVQFGPPFALTTCVFLLTSLCMVPGICLGVTSYKRFNPLNRDTAYSQAPQNDPDGGGGGHRHHVRPQSQEGWN